MESLSGMKWNGCPASNGITVRDQMEWVSGMDWNTQIFTVTGLKAKAKKVSKRYSNLYEIGAKSHIYRILKKEGP
jgi:hypothetical protein